jgi:glycosyltransferase involved in cell wall biosynthesis
MRPQLSIVIPVFNEQENIPQLYQELKKSLENIGRTYEIIFVDDGSEDETYEILEKPQKMDKSLKLIQLRKNFGKSDALSLGFKHASGDVIITMDGDLQDDPTEIPKFLEKIKTGCDLVVGWKFQRKDPFTKRFPSKIFNLLTSIISGLRIHDYNCGFKAFQREVTQNIEIYGELYRYIPALAYMKGYNVCEIKINHRPRVHGKSKYGPGRLIKGFLDLITITFLKFFMRKPLHLFGSIGGVLTISGFLISFYMLILWTTGKGPIGDRPLLMLGVLLLILGIQFFSFGLLGEMITKISNVNDEEHKIKQILGE